MLSYSFLKSEGKKAQVAETMTWVVATIIIIVLLVASIYLSSLLGKSKDLKVGGIESSEENNWVNSKTQMALEINNENVNRILNWVSESSLEGGEDDEGIFG
jgi:hypothetical protein